MATSIYFNGRQTSVPGSYSEVDATGLAAVGLGASGIVACIGEAEGGEPGAVNTVTNPGSIAKTYRSGDLREAGSILFDPSKDADIQAGAQAVKFVKVNPATQSAVTLADPAATDSIALTSRDYGSFTDKINVDVSDGTDAGTKAITVSLDSQVETFDNIGSNPVATIQYTGTFASAPATFDPLTGLNISVDGSLTSFAGRADVNTVSSVGIPLNAQPNGTETLDYVSSDPADTFDVIVYGVVGGVADSETITLTGTVQANGAKTFTSVQGIYLAGSPVGTITVDGNTSGSVVAAITSATSAGMITNWNSAPLTHRFPSKTVEITVASSNAASTDRVYIAGTDSADAPVAQVVTLAAGAGSFSTNFKTVQLIGVGETSGGETLTFKMGPRFSTGNVTLVSDNAADTQNATIYGLDAAGTAVQTEVVALTGTVAVASSSTFSVVVGVKLSAAATGNVSASNLGDSSTAASSLFATIAATGTSFGVDTGLGVVPNGTVTFTLPTGPLQFHNTIVIGTDSTGAAASELVAATDGSAVVTATNWATIDTISTSLISTASIDVDYSPVSLTVAAYSTLDTWLAYFSDQPEFSLTQNTPVLASSYSIANLDAFSADVDTAYSILDILQSMISALNAGSSLVSAARASGAKNAPANTALPVFLTGGSEGVTAFANWQSALDTLRDEQVNTIVVLTTDAAVQAAVIAHCAYMCGAGRNERDCVLGAPSGTTLTAAKALALSMNTRHARLCIQDVQRYNTDGALEQFAPPFTACVAAGMQAGSEVGTSLTAKYANVLDVYGQSSYTIRDNGNELINAGLCVLEKVPNRGFRWLRNVTTYLQDNNLAYTEASVNEAANYAVYNLRTSLEEVVGQKGFAGTVTAAEGIAISILGQQVRERVITTYRNLAIVLSADTMTVDVEIAPVTPVNFVKTTVHLVSAEFATA